MRLAPFAAFLAAGLASGPVWAQQGGSTPATPPTDPSQPASSPPQTVVVTAAKPAYRSTIDRRSYSIAGDLQQTTGSLADVLRDVPSVQVDIDGNVSLRGDPSVTILVDGKPSALFSGPGRAQALQSISPGQYERVEVMTNPPASMTAEGTGGVINLISKAPPKGGAAPSATGTVKANLGTDDRFDVGADGTYSGHGLSLNGGADWRRSGFHRDIGSNYELPDSATGALSPAQGLLAQGNRGDTLTLYGAAGYDLDPRDHLDAGFNLFSDRSVQSQESTYDTAAATGPLALNYDAPGFWHGHYFNTSETLGLTHTFADHDQSLAVKLSVSQSHIIAQTGARYAFTAPVQPALYQDVATTADFPEIDLKIEYKITLPNKAKLTTGYEGKFDRQGEGGEGLQGPSATLAVADPAFAQDFTFGQQVHALYATYDQTFGKLDVQPGLRLESVSLQTDLVTTGEKGRQDYVEAYPSLHLTYDLNDASEIKASYGRRAERPEEFQLDPFRIYATPTSYSAGNPDLRPAITQSYELGYEYRQKTTDMQATLFYRDKSDLLTTVTQDIGDDVLLSTFENLGHAHDLGLELVANRDLTKTLSVNASIDLTQSDVDAANLDILAKRSAFTVAAQVTLKWKVTPKDFIQIGGQSSGRQLTAQGYRGGAVFSNFGWRRQFDDRWAAVLTADNPFGLSRRTIVIDTPTLNEIDKRKYNPVAAFIGLTYAFGAAPKSAANSFDFNAKGSGG